MPSFVSRIYTELGNAMSDAYGHMVYGDEAGKSATIGFVVRGRSTLVDGNEVCKFDLGMTFLNVNGRAYVRAVDPDSDAFRAGILPRDSLQLAIVLDDTEMEDFGDDEDSTLSYVMELEKNGGRTSFGEFKSMFQSCTIPFAPTDIQKDVNANNIRSHSHTAEETDSGQIFESSPDGNEDGSKMSSMFRGLQFSMIQCSTSPVASSSQRPSPASSSGEAIRPVVLIFRRTRKRELGGTSHISFPTFRLDDECDRAACLVRRLAPTLDTEPQPDAWDEIAHDAAEYIGRKRSGISHDGSSTFDQDRSKDGQSLKGGDRYLEMNESIPLDSLEEYSKEKISRVRSRMTDTQGARGGDDDVEASTIRGMIQHAKGLAFVRTSKVVLGVSIHVGSGILISRLDDGTWSAPSAIGMYGGGVGVQFGLEVADYIFILQTKDALEHFRRGDNYTIGGNMGAAVAGVGREAYGAASVNGGMCNSTSVHSNDDLDGSTGQLSTLAPIVAYAKSQGLYFGVSLEGSKIFTRKEINLRSYKFGSGREVTADEILTGVVPPPLAAEDLYEALHSVEFMHEVSTIPRPPDILRNDLGNEWTALDKQNRRNSSSSFATFLSNTTCLELEELSDFETKFKNFMYGGVSVQRIVPRHSGGTMKLLRESRTLWLMLPEVGALRLGFVSRINESPRVRQEHDEYSIGSSVMEEKTMLEQGAENRRGKVCLSHRHSIALTDVTTMSQKSDYPNGLFQNDQAASARFITIKDVTGTKLMFIANSARETELLSCGLKLLLERETNRLGVRGGEVTAAFKGMSAEKARGNLYNTESMQMGNHLGTRTGKVQSQTDGYISSDNESEQNLKNTAVEGIAPEGRKSWSQVPARSHLRLEAARSKEEIVPEESKEACPKYTHGQLIERVIEEETNIPLPLPLCRALFLDSSSPVITKWEIDRGDTNYSKVGWVFPSSSVPFKNKSEHEVISTNSMTGGYRTIKFDRIRNGQKINLSETLLVDVDDNKQVLANIIESIPRRGFSVKVRILFTFVSKQNCQMQIIAELRPMGKNMTNQEAVHKALNLTVDELKTRYGRGGYGLLGRFLSVANDLPSYEKKHSNSVLPSDTGVRGTPVVNNKSPVPPVTGKVSADRSSLSKTIANRINPKSRGNTKASNTKVQKDAIIAARKRSIIPADSPMSSQGWSPSSSQGDNKPKTHNKSPERPRRIPPQEERPSTPSVQDRMSNRQDKSPSPSSKMKRSFFSDGSDQPFGDLTFQHINKKNGSSSSMTVEVKPLPKIPLQLMPSPREEDEEESSVQPSSRKLKRRKARTKRRSFREKRS